MSQPPDQPSPQQPSTELETQVKALTQHIELLGLKVERQSLQSQQPQQEKKQPWWATAIQFLGLPALVIAILLQFGQATEVPGNKAKTAAETSKLATEELKARAELQEIVDRLEEKRATSAAAYTQELQRVLPTLRDTIGRLQQAERSQTSNLAGSLVAKYLVIWALLAGLGLVFQIVGHFWSALISSLGNLLYHFPEGRQPAKWRKTLARRFSLVQPIVYPLPYIVDWAVQVVIFAALIIPLFNTASSSLGSKTTLQSVIQSARHFDIGDAVRKAEEIISK